MGESGVASQQYEFEGEEIIVSVTGDSEKSDQDNTIYEGDPNESAEGAEAGEGGKKPKTIYEGGPNKPATIYEGGPNKPPKKK